MSDCLIINDTTSQEYLQLVEIIKASIPIDQPLFDKNNRASQDVVDSINRAVKSIANPEQFKFNTNKIFVLESAISDAFGNLFTDENREAIIKDIIPRFQLLYKENERLKVERPKYQVNKYSDNLSDVFNNISDAKRFRNDFRSGIIPNLFYDAGKNLVTDKTLGANLASYKQDVYKIYIIPALEELYNKSKNLKEVMLLESARNINFTKYKNSIPSKDLQTIYDVLAALENSFTLEDGKFDGTNLDTFRAYLTIKNFDDLLNTLFEGMIEIAPGKNDFAYSNKYSLNIAKQINQRYDDSIMDYGEEANKLVNLFTESVKDSNNQPFSFNDFTAAVAYIKKKYPQYSSMFRTQPEYIRRAWKEAAEKIQYDLSATTRLKDAVKRFYGKIFNEDNTDSIYSIYKNNSDVRNNLYNLIVNSITSQLPLRYLQTTVDEDGIVQIKELTRGSNMTRINSISNQLSLATRAKNFDELQIPNYGIQRITNSNDKLLGYKLYSDAKSISFMFNGRNVQLLYNDEAVKDVPSFIRENSELFRNIANSLFNNTYNESYWKEVVNSNDVEGIVDLIGIQLSGYDFYTRIKNTDQQYSYDRLAEKYIGMFDSRKISVENTTRRKIINAGFNSINPRYLFKGQNGLFALNKANDIVNGALNKSYVVNSEEANLPLSSVANTMGEDEIIITNIKNIANHPASKNIFISNNILGPSFLDHEFINHGKKAKKIAQMTAQELAEYDFVYRYLLGNGTFYLQPTVYSDKSSIWTKAIYLNNKLDFSNYDETEFPNLKQYTGKTLNQLSPSDVYTIHRETMAHQFRQYLNNYTTNLSKLLRQVITNRGLTTSIFANYNDLVKQANELKITPEEFSNAILTLQNNGEKVELIHTVQYIQKGNQIIFGSTNFNFYYNYFNDPDTYKKKNEIQDKFYVQQLQEFNVRIYDVDSDGWVNEKLRDMISEDGEWYDNDTKEMILYKVTKNGEAYNSPLTIEDALDDKVKVTLNPRVEKYLALSRLGADSYNSLLQGFSFGHKGKSEAQNYIIGSKFTSNVIAPLLNEESARQIAMWKRGVIAGATYHPFGQGLINGVPLTIKVSTIEDISDNLVTWHVSDIGNGINNLPATPHDGSIFVNGCHFQLENASLPDIKLDSMAKKPIAHIDMTQYGTSGLLKCATFSLNNEYIRNSNQTDDTSMINAKQMFRKMLDIKWGDDGNAIRNKIIELSQTLNRSNYYYFNPVDNQYYKLLRIEEVKTVDNLNNETVTYKKVVQNVNTKENIEIPVNLNSNYDLWEIAGGEWSVIKDGDKFVPSENSINFVVRFMNDVRFLRPGYENLTNIPEDQVHYRQPLKEYQIAYLANRSGFKNGVANGIPSSEYYKNYEEKGQYSMPYQEIDTRWLGIQLNAGHSLDESEISEMTQIISALEQAGITHNLAIQAYRAIQTSIDSQLSDLENMKPEDQAMAIAELLIDSYGSRDNQVGLTQAYLNNTKNTLQSNKETAKIPFNDPSISQALESAMMSMMSDEVIRRNYPGLAAVQAPSYAMVRIYDDGNTIYKNSDLMYSSNSAVKKLVDRQKLDMQVDKADIEIGDYVQLINNDGTHTEFRVLTHAQLMQVYNHNNIVARLGSKGRNLRAQNAKFTINIEGFKPIKINLFQLDSSILSWDLYDILNSTRALSYEGLMKSLAKADPINYTRILEVQQRLFEDYTNPNGFQTAITEYLKNKASKPSYKNIAGFLNTSLQKEFQNIQDKKSIVPVALRAQLKLELNNNTVYNIDNLTRQPNEIMVGRMYARKFYIEPGDSINDVMAEGINFFKGKLLNVYEPNPKVNNLLYDAYLVKDDGNHIYITTREPDLTKNNELHSYKPAYITRGKTKYLLDNGVKSVKLNDDYKYYKQGGSIIIYVPDENLDDFLKDAKNSRQFNGLEFSEANLDNRKKYLKSTLLSKQAITEYTTNPAFNPKDIRDAEITARAQKMFTSFKQSLNYISGRIPSQSMQSFMNTKVVGYIDTDSNIVWVPNAVLVFQGSKSLDRNYTNCWNN